MVPQYIGPGVGFRFAQDHVKKKVAKSRHLENVYNPDSRRLWIPPSRIKIPIYSLTSLMIFPMAFLSVVRLVLYCFFVSGHQFGSVRLSTAIADGTSS